MLPEFWFQLVQIFAQQPRPHLTLDNATHSNLEKTCVQKPVKYLYPYFVAVDFKIPIFTNQ
jgi:hypothetical protein